MHNSVHRRDMCMCEVELDKGLSLLPLQLRVAGFSRCVSLGGEFEHRVLYIGMAVEQWFEKRLKSDPSLPCRAPRLLAELEHPHRAAILDDFTRVAGKGGPPVRHFG